MIMSGALNSVLGPVGGFIANTALNVASVAFPPLGIATSLANMLTQGVGQAVGQAAQMLHQECGMPKFLLGGIGDLIKKALEGLTQPSQGGCDHAAHQHFNEGVASFANDFAKQIFEGAKRILDLDKGDGGKSSQAGKKSAGSWLEAIAQAMGEAAGKQAEKLVTLSNELGSIAKRDHSGLEGEALTKAQGQDAKDSAEVNAKFQAASQEFNMLQSAFSNAIKSIGEGMSQMARKG